MTAATKTAYSPSPPASVASSNGGAEGVPPSEVLEAEITQARAVPHTFMTSVSAWWNSNDQGGQDSQTRLLRRLAFFRSEGQPDVAPTEQESNPITARVQKVDLKSNAGSSRGIRSINSVAFTTPATADSKHAVVITHGYGAGLAFFYRNWKEIAESSAQVGRRAYAIDWLGMGLSSRPDPKVLYAAKNASMKTRVETAENFFLDSLDEWREKMGIEQMTLIGHSLGGYLSAAYALKYPDRVDRLVLLSPAGVPDHPDKGEEIPDGEVLAAAIKEVNEPQTEATTESSPTKPPKLSRAASSPPAEYNASGANPGDVPVSEKSSFNTGKRGNQKPSTATRKLFTYLWEGGFSPFSIVRGLGPMGPMLVGRYSTRRFSALPEDDIKDLHDYVWTITKMKGSSEYAITHLLAPGAHARWPIAKRISAIKIPVVFSYGSHDWMDIQGGHDAIRAMRAAGNHKGKVVQIDHAGHHLYLDNAPRTNAMLRSEILAAARK